jgi:phosphoglycolate phosphatase
LPGECRFAKRGDKKRIVRYGAIYAYIILNANKVSVMINIIWDLDGTLVDSKAEILFHLELALRDASVNISDQVRPIVIGPPLDVLLRDSFPPEVLTEEKLNKVISSFRTRYDNSGFTMTDSFKGIEEIISDTANFVHNVITNKPNPAARNMIEKMGWAGRITSLKALSVHAGRRKPKTELFAELIDESGGNASSFIGIGDARTDAVAAKNNNITAVGVLWGSGTREEMEGCCDYLFEDTKQLRDFLYGWEK